MSPLLTACVCVCLPFALSLSLFQYHLFTCSLCCLAVSREGSGAAAGFVERGHCICLWVSPIPRSHLSLPLPEDPNDEYRLVSLREKGFFTVAEARQRLQEVERELAASEETLRAMDLYSPLTATKVSSRSRVKCFNLF